MTHRLPPAVFLMGPTATGKTDIARRLAAEQDFQFELISVDSAQVYRGLDIGTAKGLNATDHHLVDIRDPSEPYSAADFRQDAIALMEDITREGRIPLLVGGTMLYFKALRDGLAKMPQADPAIRAAILEEASREGWESLHSELTEVDPVAAGRIKPTDTQRLQRALEVYRLTGQPISIFHEEQKEISEYEYFQLGFMLEDRSELHRRIEVRFRQMLEAGFIEEVRALYERGDLNRELPAIRAVGYRQIWDYLDGKIDYEGMIEQVLAATRQLAKRQITWMRGWNDLEFIHALPYPDYQQVLNRLRSAII